MTSVWKRLLAAFVIVSAAGVSLIAGPTPGKPPDGASVSVPAAVAHAWNKAMADQSALGPNLFLSTDTTGNLWTVSSGACSGTGKQGLWGQMFFTTDSSGNLKVCGTGSVSDAFTSLIVAGQTTIAASGSTALTVVAGANVTLTTDNTTKTLTIDAGGGGTGCNTSGATLLKGDGAGGCSNVTSSSATGANVSLGGTLAVTGHLTFEGVTSTGATGTGALVFGTSPTFTTPTLGTPASGVVTNLTGTLTHITFDTAGTSNVFKINGTSITGISGNSATVASTTGSLTNGDCVKIDASGNFIDNGSACTSGANSQTVTSSVTLSKIVTYCDPTSGAVNLALPSAVTFANTGLYVKQINSAANACTVTGTIDGNTNDILGGIGYGTSYFSDGTSWRAHTIVTPPLAAPGADSLVGYDNTNSTGVRYFGIGSGLSYNTSTHVLSSSGGSGCSPASTNGKILTDNGSGGCSSNTTGSGVLTALGIGVGSSGSFVANGGALGTPTSGVGTNITGLPISTGVSGLGTGVATALGVNTGSAGSFLINGFTSVPVSGQTTVTASNATALTLAAGTNMTITTDNSTKTITFTASGGGGSGCSTSGTGNVLTSDGAGGCTSNAAATYSAGKLTLGTNVTTLGAVKMFGNTSGDVTIQPNAVAGTAVSLILPAVSATIASTTGSVTTDNCAKWDSSGRLVDSGGTCSGGTVVQATIQGRLTLESGVPVSSTDQTAKSHLFWTPYNGNTTATYDSSVWTYHNCAEYDFTLSSLTSGRNYDVFLDWSGSVCELTLSAAWNSDNVTRTDALTTQDGVKVLNSNHAKRYVGTIRTTGTTTTEDSAAKRFVWNNANRVMRSITIMAADTTWTYSTDTFHQANGNTANQLDVVVGDVDSTITITLLGVCQLPGTAAAGGGADATVSIGEDSTSSPSALALNHNISITGAVVTSIAPTVSITSYLTKPVPLGRHFYVWLEKADTATTTWQGVNGSYYHAGMTGTIQN